MPDITWLAVLGGLFLATLAFVRLCDEAWDEPPPRTRRADRVRPADLPRRRSRAARTLL